MQQHELTIWINELIDKNELWRFYKSKEWIELRNEILKESHYECEICRKKGKINKAELVHHQQFVRNHPHLSLSKYYTHKGKRYKNLISVCRHCHETVCHPERMKSYSEKNKFTNEERW